MDDDRVTLERERAALRDEVERLRPFETRVRGAERRMRGLADALPIGIFRATPETKFTFWNRAFADVVGLPRERAADTPWRSLVHPDDLERVETRWNLYEPSDTPFAIEFRVRRPDGSVAWVVGFTASEFDAGGRLVGFFGTLTDVTSFKRMQDALARSEVRYRSLFESSDEAIWYCDVSPPVATTLPVEEQAAAILKGAVVADCNEACARRYGAERPSDLVGTRIAERFFDDPAAGLAATRELVENEYRTADTLTVARDPRGDERHFLNTMRAAIEGDRVVGVWGTRRDITETIVAEETLRETERKLATLWSNLPGLAYRSDATPARRMQLLSEGFVEITGLRPEAFEEAHGSVFEALLFEEDREPVDAAVAEALREGRAYELNYRIRDAEGGIRWVWDKGQGVVDRRGWIVAIEGFMFDVTDWRRAEDARRGIERKLQETQKLESLGVLAGGIAHDFNNLLTSIIGNASIALLGARRDAETSVCLSDIEQAARRAAELCRQLLAYSGKGRFVVEAIDVNALVRDTLALIRLSISKKASLQFDLGEGLPPIEADATQIRQVLMNLVINASDALGDRTGRITVGTSKMEADRDYLVTTHLAPNLPEGEYVCIEVHDTGCGMTPEVRKHVFEPFFTTKATGRGLGLAAVLGIARSHRGALMVYSEPGRGSTFKLLLPAAKGEATRRRKPPAVADDWRGHGRALVIDDEDSVRTVAARMLEVLGFQSDTATDGLEGLELFRRRPDDYRFVLLDLTMPKFDGAELFREIRRIRPETPVLLMSGFNEQETVSRFTGKGLAGFVQKPFQIATLRDKIRTVLDRFEGKGDPN